MQARVNVGECSLPISPRPLCRTQRPLTIKNPLSTLCKLYWWTETQGAREMYAASSKQRGSLSHGSSHILSCSYSVTNAPLSYFKTSPKKNSRYSVTIMAPFIIHVKNLYKLDYRVLYEYTFYFYKFCFEYRNALTFYFYFHQICVQIPYKFPHFAGLCEWICLLLRTTTWNNNYVL